MMRITDPAVRRRLAEAAQGAETVSQCVDRLITKVDTLLAECATLKRQLRYQRTRVQLLEAAEQARIEQPEHLTEAQAIGIERARRRYYGR
mgnify:CR=1 FL=1